MIRRKWRDFCIFLFHMVVYLLIRLNWVGNYVYLAYILEVCLSHLIMLMGGCLDGWMDRRIDDRSLHHSFDNRNCYVGAIWCDYRYNMMWLYNTLDWAHLSSVISNIGKTLLSKCPGRMTFDISETTTLKLTCVRILLSIKVFYFLCVVGVTRKLPVWWTSNCLWSKPWDSGLYHINICLISGREDIKSLEKVWVLWLSKVSNLSEKRPKKAILQKRYVILKLFSCPLNILHEYARKWYRKMIANTSH